MQILYWNKMLQISKLVLILQIGFNAALNNAGYNTSPLIRQSRSVQYGHSRRSWNSNHYHPQISDRTSSSESDQSDSEETSLEENRSKSQPQKNWPHQKNTNLRYDSRTVNDVSLEQPSIGRLGFNHRSDVSINRADMDFRRPFLRNRPINLRRAHNGSNRKKGSSGVSLVNGLGAATAGEDANYLRSLLSLIEQPNLRRDQNRKYYRNEDDLSLEISPDSLELDENISSSLPETRSALDSLSSSFEVPDYRRTGSYLNNPQNNKFIHDNDNLYTNYQRSRQSKFRSANFKQNNRKNNRISDHDLRFQINAPATDNSNAYTDTILISGEGKLDNTAIARMQLRKSSTNLNKNRKSNRIYDDHSNIELLSDDKFNGDNDNLYKRSSFRGPKTNLRNRKLRNTRPKLRNNDHIVGLDVISEDTLSSDDDDGGKITPTVLYIGSVDDLILKHSPVPTVRSHAQKQQVNNQYVGRNFLRLALPPNEKLSLDEDMASSLSELLSENVDNLKLVPISLRSSKPTNWNHRRRNYDDAKLELPADDNNISEDETLRNLSLDTLDDLSIESPVMRSFNPNNNTPKGKDNNDPIENLVPYHEYSLRSNNAFSNNKWNNKPSNTRKNNNNLNPSSELHNGNSTVLRLGNSQTLGLRKSNENKSSEHDTTDVLHLDYPWNDQLSPNNVLSSKSTPGLRNRDLTRQNNDAKELKLEYPWNDRMNPSYESGIYETKRGLKHREKTGRKITDPQNYELKLEYPWNDQLSPDNGSGKDENNHQLRNREHTDRQNADPKNYDLELEYPWNDKLSSDGGSAKSVTNRELRIREPIERHITENNYELELEYPWDGKMSSYGRSDRDSKNSELNLEYPWNDKLSPNDQNGKHLTNRQLRHRDQTDRQNIHHENYELKLEYPWNGQMSANDKNSRDTEKQEIKLRNGKDTDRQSPTSKDYELKLEFPWNNQLSPNDENDKDSTNRGRGKLRNRVQNRQNIDPKNYELDLEYPWNDELGPGGDALRLRSQNRRTRKNYNINRRLYNNKYHIKRQIYDNLNLRGSDENLNEERILRALSIARRSNNNEARAKFGLRSSNEGVSNYRLPLDRRPNLRNQGYEHNPTDFKRSGFSPLPTTPSSPNAARIGTYNDTIIFRYD